ncbi:MAG: hypothetical protein IJ247_00475 [Bacilli bacterium]|nr:hypothetical protein [Bacilli bacterium]
MRSRRKKWAAPYLEAHKEIVIEKIDAQDKFFLSRPLVLEVGAGKGDFAIAMSERLGGSYLAIERDVSIAGTMARRLENKETNIRIINDDFDNVFSEDISLRFDAIYLNFSDPWPKKKQGKRRLTASSRLDKFYSLLLDEGKLYFKTDSDILYESTLENIESSKFKILERYDVYVFDEKEDAMSEYERKARDKGLAIHKLVLGK